MPIYEYHCGECSAEFEKYLRSMFAKETITCPTCGSEHVIKALSLFGTASGGSTGPSPASSCGPVG